MRNLLACSLLSLLSALPVAGQGISNAAVHGDSIDLAIILPGGLAADVSVAFEDASGLSLSSLGISAQVVDPADSTLSNRLAGTSVAAGFPVLLRIEPPATGGLAFSGVATLEIHTHNLEYVAGTPLRLFSAPLGGDFKDITTYTGAGSYRVRGTSGGFSEFLIVTDLRPVNQVVTAKLHRLDQALDERAASMPGPLHGDLAARLDAVRANNARGDVAAAIQEVDGFLAVVEQHAGTDLPDEWRAARDVDNAAGTLRALAMTLRFSLVLKNSPGL